MRWQKHARVGVAAFGIACAIVVYAAIGERATVTPPAAPARIDPKAILESEGAQVQQERGAERDFDITSERTLAYEGGATKLINVVISVRGRGGRDFILKGREAQSGADQRELQLAGDVVLQASDGFQLKAESGSFNQDDGIVRVPGQVAFTKGRMTGSGAAMRYDETNDIITIAQNAQVTMTDEAGATQYAFSATAGVLDRKEHVLTLDGQAKALRGEQAFEGDRALARLTPEEDGVTFIELRGNARVSGGGDAALDAMSARDIDMDYTDDGVTLERVLLVGGAAVALTGEDGAAGRQIIGETIDLTLGADGTVTRATGRDNVQLTLPASAGTSARTVKAKALDATGEPGRGLTQARFTDDVEYREEAQRGANPRTATSRALTVAMDGNAISSAVFSGSVTFEEKGLRASGADARYQPVDGTLRITGADAGGGPRVADEQVTIEAQKSIDVTLGDRQMRALGAVRTTLRAAGGSRLPGLLSEKEPANVNADALEYEGEAGKAVYKGNALLLQGQTGIRGELITLDQKQGDLAALGSALKPATSTIVLDMAVSIGTAREIRYDDATRVISYLSHIPPPPPPPRQGMAVPPPAPVVVAPRGRGAVAPVPPPAVQVQLNGPQGQMRADRIEIVLAKEGSRAERLEAYTNVNTRVDLRVATGDRLTYFAEDERYVMVGANAVAARVIDACRETSGKTLTFFKAADRIIVDGNEEIRTQTKSGGPCSATPPAR
jgi:lipopolysaccharide export system protein LptA